MILHLGKFGDVFKAFFTRVSFSIQKQLSPRESPHKQEAHCKRHWDKEIYKKRKKGRCVKILYFVLFLLLWMRPLKHTNLQKANITQYVQHSHFSKTKKDRDTDALQWTASAGCTVSQGKKNLRKSKYALTCK